MSGTKTQTKTKVLVIFAIAILAAAMLVSSGVFFTISDNGREELVPEYTQEIIYHPNGSGDHAQAIITVVDGVDPELATDISMTNNDVVTDRSITMDMSVGGSYVFTATVTGMTSHPSSTNAVLVFNDTKYRITHGLTDTYEVSNGTVYVSCAELPSVYYYVYDNESDMNNGRYTKESNTRYVRTYDGNVYDPTGHLTLNDGDGKYYDLFGNSYSADDVTTLEKSIVHADQSAVSGVTCTVTSAESAENTTLSVEISDRTVFKDGDVISLSVYVEPQVKYKDNGASVDVGVARYNGIASTEYNPEYWKDTGSMFTGDNDWLGPSFTKQAKVTIDVTMTIANGNSYKVNIPDEFQAVSGIKSSGSGSAVFTPNNEGSPSYFTVTCTGSGTLTATFTISKAVTFNKVFAGWNTASDGSGKQYLPGDVVPDTITDLWAVWIEPDIFSNKFSVSGTISWDDGKYTIDDSEFSFTKSSLNDEYIWPFCPTGSNTSDNKLNTTAMNSGFTITYGDSRVARSMYGTIYKLDYENFSGKYNTGATEVVSSISTSHIVYITNMSIPTGTYRSLDSSSLSRMVTLKMNGGNGNSCAGDVIIDNVGISGNKDTSGKHGDNKGSSLFACGYVLIIGTNLVNTQLHGDDPLNTNYAPQLFGGKIAADISAGDSSLGSREMVYARQYYGEQYNKEAKHLFAITPHDGVSYQDQFGNEYTANTKDSLKFSYVYRTEEIDGVAKDIRYRLTYTGMEITSYDRWNGSSWSPYVGELSDWYYKGRVTVDIGTCVIVHSGIFANIVAGSFSSGNNGNIGARTASGSGPLSTYLVMKGGTVTDTLAGGSSGGSGYSTINSTHTSEVSDVWSGGTFVYILDKAFLSGDQWEDKKCGFDHSSIFNSHEASILEGGHSRGMELSRQSKIIGSTHVFLSGRSSSWDVQAGGRSEYTHTDYAYQEITGRATVRHIACGTITDGAKNSDNNCVDNSDIYVGGRATVASVFGAGYDTYNYPKCKSMIEGTITVTVDGGRVGNVFGGGYRGSVGNGNLQVYVNVLRGEVMENVYGGGSGGLEKLKHLSDGRMSTQTSSSYTNSMGKSYVVGNIQVLVSGTAVVNGSVYGGGMSVPKLSTYTGDGKVKTISFNDEAGINVATVEGNTEVKITGSAVIKGSVFGGGRGVAGEYVNGTLVIPNMTEMNVVTAKGEFTTIPWFTKSDGTYEYAYDTTLFTTSNQKITGGRYIGFATVTGNSSVIINLDHDGSISQEVYGGSGYGQVNGNIYVNIEAGKLAKDVYGGGLGREGITSTKGDRTVFVQGDDEVDDEWHLETGVPLSGVEILGSVYGGSSNGDDGVPGSTKAGTTATLTSVTKVVIHRGHVEKDVFGGGLMGKTYGSAEVYVGYDCLVTEDLKSTVTQCVNQKHHAVSIDNIYAGGNVSNEYDPETGKPLNIDPFVKYLVMGNGVVKIYGDEGNSNIAITGSVMASGNSCLTADKTNYNVNGKSPETNIEMEGFNNMAESMTAIHRSDKLLMSQTTVKISGRSPLVPILGTERILSIYGIYDMMIKYDTTIVVDEAMDCITGLESLSKDGSLTTAAMPSNEIRFTKGSTLYVRTVTEKNVEYGYVDGFIILSVEKQDRYGAYAIGSGTISAGGFVVKKDSSYARADYSDSKYGVNDDIARCWYISGVVGKAITMNLQSEIGEYKSDPDLTHNITAHYWTFTTLPSSSSMPSEYYFEYPGESGDAGKYTRVSNTEYRRISDNHPYNPSGNLIQNDDVWNDKFGNEYSANNISKLTKYSLYVGQWERANSLPNGYYFEYPGESEDAGKYTRVSNTEYRRISDNHPYDPSGHLTLISGYYYDVFGNKYLTDNVSSLGEIHVWGALQKNVTSTVDIQKFQDGTNIRFVGGSFTAMSSDGDKPYQFLRPGESSDDHSVISMVVGHMDKDVVSDPQYLYSKDGYRYLNIGKSNEGVITGTDWMYGSYFTEDPDDVGKEPNIGSEDAGRVVTKTLIPSDMVRYDLSDDAGIYHLDLVFTAAHDNKTAYIGYLILNFQESKSIIYEVIENGMAVQKENVMVTNKIEVRVDLYILGDTGSATDVDYSVIMKTEIPKTKSEGKTDIMIPTGIDKGVLYFDGITYTIYEIPEYYEDEVYKSPFKMSYNTTAAGDTPCKIYVSAITNQNNTTGWSTSSGMLEVFDYDGSYKEMVTNQVGTLIGSISATVRYSVHNFVYYEDKDDYQSLTPHDPNHRPQFTLHFHILMPDGTRSFSNITVTLIEKTKVSVSFYDEYRDPDYTSPIIKSYYEGTELTESLAPSTGPNFIGWYYKGTNFANEYDYGLPITKPIELEARYTYVVTFDNGNNTSYIMYVAASDGGALLNKNAVPEPKMTGYEFQYWCLDEALTRQWDYSSDRVSEDITLYAKWAGKQILVRFWYTDEFGDLQSFTGKLQGDGSYVAVDPGTKVIEITIDGNTHKDQLGNVYSGNTRDTLTDSYLFKIDGHTEIKYKLTYSNGTYSAKYKWNGSSWVSTADDISSCYYKDEKGTHHFLVGSPTSSAATTGDFVQKYYVMMRASTNIIEPTVRYGSTFNTVDPQQTAAIGKTVNILSFAESQVNWYMGTTGNYKFICWQAMKYDGSVSYPIYEDTPLTGDMVKDANGNIIDCINLYAITATVAINLEMTDESGDASVHINAPSEFLVYPDDAIPYRSVHIHLDKNDATFTSGTLKIYTYDKNIYMFYPVGNANTNTYKWENSEWSALTVGFYKYNGSWTQTTGNDTKTFVMDNGHYLFDWTAGIANDMDVLMEDTIDVYGYDNTIYAMDGVKSGDDVRAKYVYKFMTYNNGKQDWEYTTYYSVEEIEKNGVFLFKWSNDANKKTGVEKYIGSIRYYLDDDDNWYQLEDWNYKYVYEDDSGNIVSHDKYGNHYEWENSAWTKVNSDMYQDTDYRITYGSPDTYEIYNGSSWITAYFVPSYYYYKDGSGNKYLQVQNVYKNRSTSSIVQPVISGGTDQFGNEYSGSTSGTMTAAMCIVSSERNRSTRSSMVPLICISTRSMAYGIPLQNFPQVITTRMKVASYMT